MECIPHTQCKGSNIRWHNYYNSLEYVINPGVTVMPRAYFNISSQVAKTGSGVNITCMSESYPPATDVDNYQMKHPNNTPITKVLIPEGNGVVHIISAASKGQDAGEYLCTVHVTLSFLEYPDILLQSDVVSTKLTLYGEFNIHNTYYVLLSVILVF